MFFLEEYGITRSVTTPLHIHHAKAPSTPATCRSNMSNVVSTCYWCGRGLRRAVG